VGILLPRLDVGRPANSWSKALSLWKKRKAADRLAMADSFLLAMTILGGTRRLTPVQIAHTTPASGASRAKGPDRGPCTGRSVASDRPNPPMFRSWLSAINPDPTAAKFLRPPPRVAHIFRSLRLRTLLRPTLRREILAHGSWLKRGS